MPHEALINAGISAEEIGSFQPMQGTGCKTCNGTGHKGRVGIYQVLPLMDEIRDAV